MKMNLKAALLFPACIIAAGISAQTYNDGPMELQIRVVEVKADYHPGSNQSDDFNLSGSIGGIIGQFIPIPSLEVDEITAKIWARDNVNLTWQGGNCTQGDLPMSSGGPETYTVTSPNGDVFNVTYPGAAVPQTFDLRLEAWEDDVSGDFDQLPAGLPPFFSNKCQTSSGATRCTYEGTDRDCFNVILLGDVFPEKDDVYCDGNPFQTGIDYRAAGPPCKWNDHGWSTGICPSNNFYQVRVQSYYRFTSGISCTSPIDMGVLTSGGVLTHLNNNSCYSNTLPGSRPGNDVFYKFRINSPMGIDINLCQAGTLFDTYVYLLNSSCAIIDSNDDGASTGCGTKSLISRPLCDAGDYYVVVDAKTAAATGQFHLFVTENPTFTFAAPIVKIDPRCSGELSGSAEVNATPPDTTYTYSWSNGDLDTLNAGIGAGLYSVTVTNPANGCTVSDSVTLIDPSQLVVDSVVTTDLTCSGQVDGKAQAFVSGGTPPYLNYVWNNGMQGDSLFGLPAGTYTVTVSDFRGCTATSLGSGSGVVSANNPIVIAEDYVRNVRCNGEDNGAIRVIVSGGIPGYSYNWTPNVSSNDSAINLPPGQYDLLVYDNTNGGGVCFELATFSITEPDELVSTIAGTQDNICFGGTIGGVDLEVSGGTRDYAYSWTDGSTRGDLFGSPAGTVSVTVTDANGCTVSSDTVLTEPSDIVATVSTDSAGCYGTNSGSVNLVPSGGTPNYSYIWSNNGERTEDISGLQAGNYQVAITDANGCTKVVNVSVYGFSELEVQRDVTNPSCIGKDNGNISISATGAGPFTYNWSNGSNDTSLANLPFGSYTATVTDNNGCTVEVVATLAEPTTNCEGGTFDVAVPNAFSPNGDGYNQFFDIYRDDNVKKVGVKIYDRWGALIYENFDQPHGEGNGWNGTINGKEAQIGAYLYVMEIEYHTPPDVDRPTQKTGTVTLLR